MQQNQLALHEKLDAHEYLAFKNVCTTKAIALAKLVNDPQLKALLNEDLEISKNQIREISSILATTLQ